MIWSTIVSSSIGVSSTGGIMYSSWSRQWWEEGNLDIQGDSISFAVSLAPKDKSGGLTLGGTFFWIWGGEGGIYYNIPIGSSKDMSLSTFCSSWF